MKLINKLIHSKLTDIICKSITLVPVIPVLTRPFPLFSKNPYESLLSSELRASSSSKLVSSDELTTAPVASVGPSCPSVPHERKLTLQPVNFDSSSRLRYTANARAISWFLPPFPGCALSTVVVSPPPTKQIPRADWRFILYFIMAASRSSVKFLKVVSSKPCCSEVATRFGKFSSMLT